MKLKTLSWLIFCCATNLEAGILNEPSKTPEVSWVGTLDHRIELNVEKSSKTRTIQTEKSLSKQIKLMEVELSKQAKESLEQKAEQALAQTSAFKLNKPQASYTPPYPDKIDLTMNEVPVLDQGIHGTCTTFAITAALDAALGQGDYISQTCSLLLGNYLSNVSYLDSGWNGASARERLNMIDVFGIVSKEKESQGLCAGLSAYPVNKPGIPDESLTPEVYYQLSETIEGYGVHWSSVLDAHQAFSSDHFDTSKTLNDVKAALYAGDRLTVASLLWSYHLGLVGAVGKHHTRYDTWVLTNAIARDVYLDPSHVAAHEMVITGYDDPAVAVDEEGHSHQGLLTLRNSWGSQVGNQGDFYMSYDYFKLFVMEVQRIRHATA